MRGRRQSPKDKVIQVFTREDLNMFVPALKLAKKSQSPVLDGACMGGHHGKKELEDVLPFCLKVFCVPNGSFLFQYSDVSKRDLEAGELIDSPAMTIWCSPDRMANDFEKQTKGVTDYLERHGIHMDADDPWPGDNWLKPIHMGWIKAHGNGQTFQDNLKVFNTSGSNYPKWDCTYDSNGHSRTMSLGGYRL
ncbi:hypothetical protein TURU_037655 [Turdus rufiventris]|nr:hypothetical protein TURU_037655 [Turdus rufiventris]